ncbi:MAG TPA: glycoside hydrolase family 99-like domain-containing protein, partial [Armatimonadota bacterium]|nr:glycoside hydrolase family 99-like domain-containing protein [Armatimonadota bacterium]
AALDAFRAKVVAAGFPGLHLQAILWGNIPATVSAPGDATPTQNSTIAALGFDSLTNYQWCHYVRPHGDYADWAEKAIAAWEGWERDFSVPFFPHVSIGWDTNPRYAKRLTEFVAGGTPERFAHYLRAAKAFVDRHALHPKLITINAWNEWSEGSYLEPDTQFEYGYLDAVKKVFC